MGPAHLFWPWLRGSFAFSALLLLLLAPLLRGQTFSVLHSFTGFDGAVPEAGLTIDAAGNLYGTTMMGGSGGCGGLGCGSVFRLAHHGSGWVFTPLYDFANSADGEGPMARVIFGPGGKLYGTTAYGGTGELQHGSVFSLSPPATFCHAVLCPWTKTTLYSFTQNNNLNDAQVPQGDLVFDGAGNLFGTTIQGGGWHSLCYEYGCGAVYELSPQNGGWAESVLYSLASGTTYQPFGGVIFDRLGNLFGTTFYGGSANVGTVYKLSPNGGTWSQSILYSFTGQSDGSFPTAGLIIDSGVLYGASSTGGSGGAGVAFLLGPIMNGWVFEPLVRFSGFYGPVEQLTMDASRNLYGTTNGGGQYGYGSVFQLRWVEGTYFYVSLHDFTAGEDGAHPFSNVVMDSGGNLYGTASGGGMNNGLCQQGCGTVWEVSP